jgi:hypothetical protein
MPFQYFVLDEFIKLGIQLEVLAYMLRNVEIKT